MKKDLLRSVLTVVATLLQLVNSTRGGAPAKDLVDRGEEIVDELDRRGHLDNTQKVINQ